MTSINTRIADLANQKAAMEANFAAERAAAEQTAAAAAAAKKASDDAIAA